MGLNRSATTLGRLALRSPLLTASGTAGSGDELAKLQHAPAVIAALGALVTKGVTLKPRAGNPEVRVVETRSGLLNSIGLQNKGAPAFVAEELPLVAAWGMPVIVNISASSVEEFGELAGYLAANDAARRIAGVEINVSCPNVKEGGVAFGVNPQLVERIVTLVKERIGPERLVVTKLTPNVTDIAEPARGAIAGGTDALSMINTLRGIAVDVEHRKPFLGNVYGGLSGPAIKPVGLFMVYECFRRLPECRDRRVPIIGIGGISDWRDALEYVMAGATAVGIGTAWFVDTEVFIRVKQGLDQYLESQQTTIPELVGAAHQG